MKLGWGSECVVRIQFAGVSPPNFLVGFENVRHSLVVTTSQSEGGMCGGPPQMTGETEARTDEDERHTLSMIIFVLKSTEIMRHQLVRSLHRLIPCDFRTEDPGRNFDHSGT